MAWTFRRQSAGPAAVGLALTLLAGLTVVGPSSAAAEPVGVIDVGEAANIEILTAASRSIAATLQPPGSTEPLYVPADLVTDTSWEIEVASVPDRTTDPRVNFVTPRTGSMVDAAIAAGLTRLSSTTCVAGRSENPYSDHPGGRGCDMFYDPHTAAGVTAGWRTANWLVANQAVLGVKYVIWQGMIWSARSTPGPWIVYTSTAYGCPNPANLTGCHYDHVHVSMY